MRMRPQRLNAAIATLFVVGSACFVLGSIPVYVSAVGGLVDGVTYFVGSLFFTSASLLQLLQAQSPSMTELERARDNKPESLTWWRPLPHDRSWLAAITQFPGTLFFNLSTAAALVHNATVQEQDRHVWRPDFFGSILFLVASTFGILALGRLRGVSSHDRCRGRSPGSTWSDRSSSWPPPWPASSCRAQVRWSTRGSPWPVRCSVPCAS